MIDWYPRNYKNCKQAICIEELIKAILEIGFFSLEMQNNDILSLYNTHPTKKSDEKFLIRPELLLKGKLKSIIIEDKFRGYISLSLNQKKKEISNRFTKVTHNNTHNKQLVNEERKLDSSLKNKTNMKIFPTNVLTGNELITFLLGNAGIRTGLHFFDNILYDHKTTRNQVEFKYFENKNPFLEETNNYCFIPRTVFVDINETLIPNIIHKPYGKLLSNSNFVVANNSKGILFPFNEPSTNEIALNLHENLRRNLEKCSFCQGFSIIQDAGELVGSEVGMHLQILLNDYCGKRGKVNFPVYSYNYKNSINQILYEISTTSFLHKYSNIIFPFELFTINTRIPELNITYEREFESEFNIISQVISSLTLPLYRSNGSIQNLIQFESTLVPSKDFKFISIWEYPLIPLLNQMPSQIGTIIQCFNTDSLLGTTMKNNIFLKNLIIFEGLLDSDSREFIFAKLLNNKLKQSSISLNQECVRMLSFQNQRIQDYYSKFKMTFCSNSSSIIPFFESVMNNASLIKKMQTKSSSAKSNNQLLGIIQNQKNLLNCLIGNYTSLMKFKSN